MVKSVILFMILGHAIPGVQALSLPDPMRPPDAMRIAPNAESVESATNPVLQSVLISATRKIAVISGQVVILNGIFGEYRLVSITQSSVLLKNRTSEKKLFLLSPEELQFANARFIKKIPQQVQHK